MRTKFLLICSLIIGIAQSVNAYDFIYDGLAYNIVSAEDNTVGVAFIDSEGSGYNGIVKIPSKVTAAINTGITSMRWEIINDTWSEVEENSYQPKDPQCENCEKGECRMRCYFKGSGIVSFEINGTDFLSYYHRLTAGELDQEADKYSYRYYLPKNSTAKRYYWNYDITDSEEHFVEFFYEWSYNRRYKFPDFPFVVKLAPVSSSTYTVTSILNDAFSNSTQVIGVWFPETIVSIGPNAFANCTGLTDITMPNSLRTIGRHAFDGCVKLKSIKLNEGLQKLEDLAFSYCSSLESLEIPSTVDYVPMLLAQKCTGLKTVKCKNVSTCDAMAFLNCDNLTNVEFSESIKKIDTGALKCCPALEKFTIPENVTYMGSSVFMYCSSLQEVTYNAKNCPDFGSPDFPVFEYTPKLTTLKIGKNVEEIPDSAFTSCTALKDVYVESKTPPSGMKDAFSPTVLGQCRLHVPYGSKDDYENEELWNQFNVVEEYDPAGISNVMADPMSAIYRVYNLNGVLVLSTKDKDEVNTLPAGLYIVGGRKVLIGH